MAPQHACQERPKREAKVLRANIYLLLATYNGAAYLREQLDSLLHQHCNDWTLLVRDDGSQDQTLGILQRYAQADSRIRMVQDDLGTLGPLGNFRVLLEAARAHGADYIFFADQDDIWESHKVGKELDLLMKAEAYHGKTTPLLVHSDMTVVNQRARVLHPSFMRYQGIRHEAAGGLRVLLVQNYVTGCTLALNRSALESVLPIPDRAVMHDWWMALVVEATGTILFLDEPSVNYRQHPNNQVGAVGFARGLFLLARRLYRHQTLAKDFVASLHQAAALLEHLNASVQSTGTDRVRETVRERAGTASPSLQDSSVARLLVGDYCDLFSQPMPWWQRLARVRQLGIQRQWLLRRLLLVVQIAWLGQRRILPPTVQPADHE